MKRGLYTRTTGPTLRYVWPARGMVVDPGIHLFGWTCKQAMGEDFDLREFHDRVLGNGTILLTQLRIHIEALIARYKARH